MSKNKKQDNEEYLIAREHMDDGEYDEALRIYKHLAANGSIDSHIFLGWMCEEGLGVEKDEDKACSYYSNAAILGSAQGQFYLAKSYGRQKDISKAMEWYLKAAEKEYSPALHRLGRIYDIGREVNKDNEKAFSYYSRAACQGHVFSQSQLAFLLMKGSEGFLARFHGIFNMLRCTVSVIIIAMKDPHDERLKD